MSGLDQFLGLDFATPEDARAWAGSVVMTDRQKHRVERFITEWETELGRGHIEHLNSRSASIAAEHEANLQSIKDGAREAKEVRRLLKAGRLSAGEGQRQLTRLAQRHREAMRIQASIQKAIESWDAASDQSPADRLKEQQERFSGVPGLGHRTLTAAILDGAS